MGKARSPQWNLSQLHREQRGGSGLAGCASTGGEYGQEEHSRWGHGWDCGPHSVGLWEPRQEVANCLPHNLLHFF